MPDQHANLPAVLIAFLIPEHDHADTPALTLLGTILGQGESSRLNRALVRDAQSALQALAFVDSRRGPGQFIAGAIANQGVGYDTLETQLWTEIGKVVAEGVTEAELEKAKSSYRADQIYGRQTTMGMAETLQHFAHFHDTIEDINSELGSRRRPPARPVRKEPTDEADDTYPDLLAPRGRCHRGHVAGCHGRAALGPVPHRSASGGSGEGATVPRRAGSGAAGRRPPAPD
jgi:hypothetical protein